MKHAYTSLATVLIIIVLTGCQSSLKNNLNNEASLTAHDELPENPLLLVPLTSSINPRDNTMSTLYGNKLAAAYAGTQASNFYPKGSVLYEVTWKQQPDSVWFGGNIPKEIFSVERIFFTDAGIPEYELYKGTPLRKSTDKNNVERVVFISSQRMAVTP